MKKAAWTLALTFLAAPPVMAAEPAKIDWSKIPANDLKLFYPGQSSYEWLRSNSHPGAKPLQTGMACADCHEGKQKTMGDKLVKGGPLESAPVKGKNGSVDLKVQAVVGRSSAQTI